MTVQGARAILGPQSSVESAFVADLATRAEVPVVSFSATSPSVSPASASFFVRAALSDAAQAGAVAALATHFGWRRVVPIYQDDDYGAAFVPFLVDALADARAEVESIEPATWYIQDRSSLSGYSSIESDADSIEALGTAFPIIFLIVAILVSLTAITRLVEEQRGLIGTYKSLGFAKRQVYAKYLIYALSACIIGGIIGNVFGFVLLPLFLFTVFDVMYVLPGYPIVYNVASGVLGILLFVVAIG